MENKAKKLKGMMWQSRDWQEEKIPALRTSGSSGVTRVLKPEVKDQTSERHHKKQGSGAGGENCFLSFRPLKVLVAQSCSTLCDSMGCSLCPRDSLGKNTGVGCHSLLQGILPAQGLNLHLPHCRQILYRLSHQESPGNWESEAAWDVYFPVRQSGGSMEKCI